ncbi:hypothetical protein N656DRAFT_692126, partial [Canariomyces notabilis]
AIAQVISLRRKVNDLAATIAKFTDAADIYLVAYIISLASASAVTQPARLLSHFDARLKSIARDVVSNSTIDEESVLREILERCYSQAVDAHGALNCNDYYIPLDYPVNPYDPDFESEQYYEHEDRLDIDEVNAAWFARECERRANNPEKREEEWIGFWFQALGNCPHGPTLFNPQTSVLQCRDFPYLWRLTDVPRYLFRAFDVDSFGQSDERVVASAESVSAFSGQRSRIDLFSRTSVEAARMLYEHLDNKRFGLGNCLDNLMSWSSSLLFVIQCAIWRCHRAGRAPSEVKICAVDTTKFPKGQFARDMFLLQAYRQTADLNINMRRFFDFRLGNEQYDNGEFLSQGEVHHGGRSCVFSLSQLIQAGLHDLYPDLAEESGMKFWTNRVKVLRSRWSADDHPTTRVDIQTALGLATACFRQFDATDVALLLLSFKNRKLKATTVQDSLENPKKYGPLEVQRYISIAETV